MYGQYTALRCSRLLATRAPRLRSSIDSSMRCPLLRGVVLLLRHDLLAIVGAARLAHAVRDLGRAARRARGHVRDGNRAHPLRTARITAGTGELSLGDGHGTS